MIKENMNEIKGVSLEYGRGFFSRRYKLSWRAPHVIDAISKTFNLDSAKFVSYIDIGCAVGDLVKSAVDRGWDAYGIEGSECAMPFLECAPGRVYFADIRIPIHRIMMPEEYTVLSCFEVAEHIKECYVTTFVNNLTKLSKNIVMSAAPPGQRGHHHYNCQPPEYWMKLFSGLGYKRETLFEERFKVALGPWRKKDGIRAFWENCLIFRSR